MAILKVPAGTYVVEVVRAFVYYHETRTSFTIASRGGSQKARRRYVLRPPREGPDSYSHCLWVVWMGCVGHNIVVGTVLRLRYGNQDGLNTLFVDWVSGPEGAG